MENQDIWIRLVPGRGSKKSGRYHRYDEDLIEIGERIAALLISAKVAKNPYALATIDDLVGSLYALVLATHNLPPFQYRPRGRKIDSRAVLKRVRAVSVAHQIRTTGKWMAGLHFNSSLFRLAAVYHRSLKVALELVTSKECLGREEDPRSLIFRAKKAYKKWTGDEWNNESTKKIHNEVNDLKHSASGKYWGRDVDEPTAISSAKEILALLEAWQTN